MNPVVILVVVLVAALDAAPTASRSPVAYVLSPDANLIFDEPPSITGGQSNNCSIRYTRVNLTNAFPSYYYKATCPTDPGCCGTRGNRYVDKIKTRIVYLQTVDEVPTIKALKVDTGCVCSDSIVADRTVPSASMPRQL